MANLERELASLIGRMVAERSGGATPGQPAPRGGRDAPDVGGQTEQNIKDRHKTELERLRAIRDQEAENSEARIQAEQKYAEEARDFAEELSEIRRLKAIKVAGDNQNLIDRANQAHAAEMLNIRERAEAAENLHTAELNRIEEEKTARTAATSGFISGIQSIGAAFGMAAKFEDTMVGGLFNMSSVIKGIDEDTEEGRLQIEEMKKAFAGTFSGKNFASSIFDKVFESTMAMAISYDTATSAFNKTTGAAGKYNEEMMDSTVGLAAMGVGIEEAAKAYGDLFENMSNFTSMSKENRMVMGVIVSTLEDVGVSGATTASNLEFLTKVMGAGAEEAAEQQKKLAEFANTLGVAPAKMAENYKAAQPIMAKFGKDVGDKMFKSLARTAKATGIEMSALLGIAAQFDTFEGAAQAAGKLNALLGGPMLSSVELLTASEADRVLMLREGVQQSGKSWASMSRFERQSIASAAGISDMTEAAKLFGTTDAEFEKNAEAQSDLAKMSEKAQTMQDKMNKIMMAFAGHVQPAVDQITKLLTLILEYIDAGGVWVKHVMTAILVIGLLVMASAAWNIVQKLEIFNLIKKIALLFLTTAKYILMAAAIAALVVVVGTYLIILGLWTLATWALSAATWAALAPFLPIILAIAAVVAVVALLIYYWDELQAGMDSLTGGMFDMWDVLLLLGGPFTWLILAGKKLYENWDSVVSGLTNLWIGFKNFMGGIWNGILSMAKAPLNALIMLFNNTLGSLSFTIPEWLPLIGGETFGIPKIDTFAEGGITTTSGPALVGEKGPELVSLPAGAQVTSNADIKRGGTSTQQGPTTVKLILNDREFAKAVINVMENKMNLRTA